MASIQVKSLSILGNKLNGYLNQGLAIYATLFQTRGGEVYFLLSYFITSGRTVMDQTDRCKGPRCWGWDQYLQEVLTYTFTRLTGDTWLRVYPSLDEQRSNHLIYIYSRHSGKTLTHFSFCFPFIPCFKLKCVRNLRFEMEGYFKALGQISQSSTLRFQV